MPELKYGLIVKSNPTVTFHFLSWNWRFGDGLPTGRRCASAKTLSRHEGVPAPCQGRAGSTQDAGVGESG
jgi:hypothetical protein